jgi:2-polyprenyl-3-methyl-5-hydroxy-6-metoxy-1,4-benzoquinol methylase
MGAAARQRFGDRALQALTRCLQTMTETFRGQLYSRYVSQHQGIPESSGRFPTFDHDVVARLPSARSTRILDVRCGHGDLVSLIRRRGWTEVSGIDISQEQVDTAARLGVTGVTRADIHQHAAAHPQSYDVVLTMMSSNTSTDPRRSSCSERCAACLRQAAA